MGIVNLSYVPHAINSNIFYPVDKLDPEYLEIKQKITANQQFDMIILFNSRNINRKHISDLIVGYKMFVSSLPIQQKDKILLFLHTDLVDQHGTDLHKVIANLLGQNYPCMVN